MQQRLAGYSVGESARSAIGEVRKAELGGRTVPEKKDGRRGSNETHEERKNDSVSLKLDETSCFDENRAWTWIPQSSAGGRVGQTTIFDTHDRCGRRLDLAPNQRMNVPERISMKRDSFRADGFGTAISTRDFCPS